MAQQTNQNRWDQLNTTMELLCRRVEDLNRTLNGQGAIAPGGTAPVAQQGGTAPQAQPVAAPQQQPAPGPRKQPDLQAPLDPTFPAPGPLSAPRGQEELRKLQAKYREGPHDLYGATTNLLGSASGVVPGAGSLAVGMQRMRGMSEAWDHWKRVKWGSKQSPGKGPPPLPQGRGVPPVPKGPPPLPPAPPLPGTGQPTLRTSTSAPAWGQKQLVGPPRVRASSGVPGWVGRKRHDLSGSAGMPKTTLHGPPPAPPLPKTTLHVPPPPQSGPGAIAPSVPAVPPAPQKTTPATLLPGGGAANATRDSERARKAPERMRQGQPPLPDPLWKSRVPPPAPSGNPLRPLPAAPPQPGNPLARGGDPALALVGGGTSGGGKVEELLEAMKESLDKVADLLERKAPDGPKIGAQPQPKPAPAEAPQKAQSQPAAQESSSDFMKSVRALMAM